MNNKIKEFDLDEDSITLIEQEAALRGADFNSTAVFVLSVGCLKAAIDTLKVKHFDSTLEVKAYVANMHSLMHRIEDFYTRFPKAVEGKL